MELDIGMLVVYSGNVTSDSGKIIAMFYGVFVFVYLGLEHFVANGVVFLIAFGYDIVNGTNIVEVGPALMNVVIAGFGNYVGGALLVGAYYVYLNSAKPKHAVK